MPRPDVRVSACVAHCVPPTASAWGLVAGYCGSKPPKLTEATALTDVSGVSGKLTSTANVVSVGAGDDLTVYMPSSVGLKAPRYTEAPAEKPCVDSVVIVATLLVTAALVTPTKVASPKFVPEVEMQPPDPSSPADTATITPFAANWSSTKSASAVSPCRPSAPP